MIQLNPEQLDALADCLAMLIELSRTKRQKNAAAVAHQDQPAPAIEAVINADVRADSDTLGELCSVNAAAGQAYRKIGFER